MLTHVWQCILRAADVEQSGSIVAHVTRWEIVDISDNPLVELEVSQTGGACCINGPDIWHLGVQATLGAWCVDPSLLFSTFPTIFHFLTIFPISTFSSFFLCCNFHIFCPHELPAYYSDSSTLRDPWCSAGANLRVLPAFENRVFFVEKWSHGGRHMNFAKLWV